MSFADLVQGVTSLGHSSSSFAAVPFPDGASGKETTSAGAETIAESSDSSSSSSAEEEEAAAGFSSFQAYLRHSIGWADSWCPFCTGAAVRLVNPRRAQPWFIRAMRAWPMFQGFDMGASSLCSFEGESCFSWVTKCFLFFRLGVFDVFTCTSSCPCWGTFITPNSVTNTGDA